MRHGNKLNHLGRQASHRKAMMANMASSLIKHKKITTTVAKAKALRVFVEPLLTKSKEKSTHNYRTVFSYLRDKEAVTELFSTVSDKIATRPGGYTRILKVGNRMGDNADMAMIELVDFNEYFTGFGKDSKAGSKRTRRGKSKAAGTETVAKAKANITEAVVENTVATDVVEAIEAPVVEINTAAETVEEVAVADVAAPVVEETSTAVEESSELESIDGIGPAFAKRLNAVGVVTLADLAGLSNERIAEIEQQDNITSAEEWSNWIEQAKAKINA
jgi:large subunit ribosomal protein L17